MTLTSIDRLLSMWLHGRSPATQDAYRRDVRQFFDSAGCGIDDAELADVQAWADEMVLAELAASTRARKLSALKSFYRFAVEQGARDRSPAQAVKLPKAKDELAQRILSEAEVIRMIALETDRRNGLILKLLYAGGLRASEICGLRERDVTERGETAAQLTVFGKGSKTRTVLIEGQLARELLTYKLTINSSPAYNELIFGIGRKQLWSIVRAAAERAGIDRGVSPHWLRHAHASHALDRGAPIHLVKETLGHASLATTSRYAHARPDESSGRYLPL